MCHYSDPFFFSKTLLRLYRFNTIRKTLHYSCIGGEMSFLNTNDRDLQLFI